MQEELHTIFSSDDRERCSELALVLESQSISAHVHWNGRVWVISVSPLQVVAARHEIDAYISEVSRPGGRSPVRPAPPGNPWVAVVAYAVAILAVAVAAPAMFLGIDWLAWGRMDGGRVFAGEWWRTLTALTLHADAAHLLGNLMFGSFFGYSVARYLGAGFGWLVILLSAAAANAANGFLSGVDHRSIGASTAVFAALGLLSSYCWRRGFPDNASPRERFAPVVAGLGLLAFTGAGGENTDLGAHLLGFVAGFGSGLAVARLGYPLTLLRQKAAGAVAIALMVGAWLAAVIANGA